MNKVARYEIIKPLNGITWKTFGDILYAIRKETRLVKNKSCFLYHKWTYDKIDYHNLHGAWPKCSDVHADYKTINGFIYNELKTEAPTLNTSNLTQSIRSATSAYDTHNRDIMSGKVSVPSFGQNQPLDLHNTTITLHDNRDNNYSATLSLLSKAGMKQFNLNQGRIEVALKVRDSSRRTILERCISGEYDICGSQLLYDANKNKYFLNLCYGFDTEETHFDPDRCMGIDLGVKLPVVMAFNFDDRKCIKIDDDRIMRQKGKLDHMLSISKHQSQWTGQGSDGHGRKKKVRAYERYTNTSRNLSDTINHTWAKYIVDTAARNLCETIQMEDLSGIKANRERFLANWTYFDLQMKIEQKAKERGIKVIKIEPAYTSQRCSRCGYISDENRKTQADFECCECGFKANADWNAAKNIATPGIEAVIRKHRPKEKVEG